MHASRPSAHEEGNLITITEIHADMISQLFENKIDHVTYFGMFKLRDLSTTLILMVLPF